MSEEQSKQRFFYCGKYFTDEKDFWKFVKEWPDMLVDLDEFKKQLDMRFRELETNVIFNKYFTNRDAYKLLRLSTDWAVGEDE